MASILPTSSALLQLAERAGLEPNDPAVQELFGRLVLRGYLKPFVPGWWELIRWKSRQVEKLVKAAQAST